jgi:hypothetical protein
MIISFDFDDTMSFGIYGPNKPIIELIKQYVADGHTCIICTARSGHFSNRHEIETFVMEYELDIKQFIYTNHDLKGPHLKKARAERHYDDAEYHLDSAIEHRIETFLVKNDVITEWKPSGTSFERVLQKFKEL